MLRGMVFVDHMNFEISFQDYYRSLSLQSPKLNYNVLFREVVSMIPNVDYLKTFIFAPKPDDFLINDAYLKGYYNWVTGFNNAKYIDVIEGRYIARPVTDGTAMDINNRSTYYKVEKGTDIHLSVNALEKAYFNAYDVAYIMSADSDYISVYKKLKMIGKSVVVVAVKGQKIGKIRPEVDDYVILDDDFFKKCVIARTNP